ncbi:hypothetical protein S40285_00530 [Stachybotrys chlorohalonatus IBT 40285]|uniref:Uncharacterized protein n=1 Tax=Stachybotrys chlorohalonatus (strain IBT 40285) TaxID=1283841 RepID=A0A084QN44_STAC4|nr:hypothetical protein S40285_00530 [Stachybotrys chlorohalonata IBT 40285]
MSWTQVTDPYEAFAKQAPSFPSPITFSQWTLSIWETSEEFPQGRWQVVDDVKYLCEPAKLRIVFSPLDLPRLDILPQTLELFRVLDVPSDFTAERIQSVSHSFGRRTVESGCQSWFHFLCKNISIKYNISNMPEVEKTTAAALGFPSSYLPQADYSWLRSGFFMHVGNNGDVTLVCFGATAKVRKRLDDFISGCAWKDTSTDPYVLFDLVLEALYREVDEAVWNMNTIFGPLEHMILDYANSKTVRRMSSKIPFAALHNCAKHIIHFSEALSSCLMVAEETSLHIGSHPYSSSNVSRRELVQTQLKERLDYRRSVLRSTQLRLKSLQKRIDNIITLSFNMVTQQDSMLMTQDSSSMKIIAAITMIFLPTTGVATVVGSQLFVSQRRADQSGWDVTTTPLFWTTWWVAIPLTLFVVVLATVWHWWMRSEQPRREMIRAASRVATFGTMGKKQ